MWKKRRVKGGGGGGGGLICVTCRHDSAFDRIELIETRRGNSEITISAIAAGPANLECFQLLSFSFLLWSFFFWVTVAESTSS